MSLASMSLASVSLASVNRASVSLPSVSTNRCEIETYFSRKAVRFGDKSIVLRKHLV